MQPIETAKVCGRACRRHPKTTVFLLGTLIAVSVLFFIGRAHDARMVEAVLKSHGYSRIVTVDKSAFAVGIRHDCSFFDAARFTFEATNSKNESVIVHVCVSADGESMTIKQTQAG